MNWYLQTGKNSDVVLNTRITYSRNLRNYRFAPTSLKEIEEIENEIKAKIYQIGYNLKFLKLKDMDEITKKSLQEKELITENIRKDKFISHSILINEEENICILINAENHLEIQVFNPGLEIENTFNLAKEVDEKINKNFDIAKSKKYGYLTTMPTNVGTGMKVNIELHLIGLNKTGNLRKILQVVNNFGIDLNQTNMQDIYETLSDRLKEIHDLMKKMKIHPNEENRNKL